MVPASSTQSARGTSPLTGIAVSAVRESGTRRASCITAEDSTARSKMGAVISGGRRVEGTERVWSGGIAGMFDVLSGAGSYG
ncbi:hypothetical protein GCM10010357_51610 [Streptomyces luteireticuli]|uniref:Uncharacterized protein n=1 Tax=Streptomyces luteireticuli TaxID=173858 RepID=A0ABN0YZA9_9ACTN